MNSKTLLTIVLASFLAAGCAATRTSTRTADVKCATQPATTQCITYQNEPEPVDPPADADYVSKPSKTPSLKGVMTERPDLLEYRQYVVAKGDDFGSICKARSLTWQQALLANEDVLQAGYESAGQKPAVGTFRYADVLMPAQELRIPEASTTPNIDAALKGLKKRVAVIVADTGDVWTTRDRAQLFLAAAKTHKKQVVGPFLYALDGTVRRYKDAGVETVTTVRNRTGLTAALAQAAKLKVDAIIVVADDGLGKDWRWDGAKLPPVISSCTNDDGVCADRLVRLSGITGGKYVGL